MFLDTYVNVKKFIKYWHGYYETYFMIDGEKCCSSRQ